MITNNLFSKYQNRKYSLHIFIFKIKYWPNKYKHFTVNERNVLNRLLMVTNATHHPVVPNMHSGYYFSENINLYMRMYIFLFYSMKRDSATSTTKNHTAQHIEAADSSRFRLWVVRIRIFRKMAARLG